MKKQIIIAIDPDTKKSGVARVDKGDRKVWAESLAFPALLDYLLTMQEIAGLQKADLKVYVEASWLVSYNWHMRATDTKAISSRKGRDIGAMQQVGKLVLQMCQHYGISASEAMPLKKIWKGNDGKITHEEISQFVKWDRKRSNQEERDALLLAWVKAELPIIIPKVK